jgi:uncharacterized membrane protein
MALVLTTKTLLSLGLLASALAAGFFYTYSVSVMPELTAAGDPLAAVRAMQGINAVIRTPVFAFAFFGALAFPLLAAATAAVARLRATAMLALAGALAYGLGVFVVTFAVNVPMNDALAAVRPTTAEQAGEVWRGYAGLWTVWNHCRALASMLSFALLLAALVRAFRH